LSSRQLDDALVRLEIRASASGVVSRPIGESATENEPAMGAILGGTSGGSSSNDHYFHHQTQAHEMTGPTADQPLPYQPPEIKLDYNTFNQFNRDVLLHCIEKFLANSDTRGLMNGLIQAATTKTLNWVTSDSERWLSPKEIKNYEPPSVSAAPSNNGGVPLPPSSSLVVDDPAAAANKSPNDPALFDMVDLHKLFIMFPSVSGNHELALLGYNWQLFIGIVYSLTAVTSFLLNAITVIVLSNCQRSELRKYLINLSMSDLLLSCFSIRKFWSSFGRRRNSSGVFAKAW
jgi:hypothetical protein